MLDVQLACCEMIFYSAFYTYCKDYDRVIASCESYSMGKELNCAFLTLNPRS